MKMREIELYCASRNQKKANEKGRIWILKDVFQKICEEKICSHINRRTFSISDKRRSKQSLILSFDALMLRYYLNI